MVRITHRPKPLLQTIKTQPKDKQLDYRHLVFLNAMGLLVAEAPEQVRRLLDSYSIELSKNIPDEDIAEALILAIGECDDDFNRDLASLILDQTLSSAYDQYDFKEFLDHSKINRERMTSEKEEGNLVNGMLSGLTTTISQIGKILSQGIEAVHLRIAKEQTQMGIKTYRRNASEKQHRGTNRPNNQVLIVTLLALGIGLIAFVAFLKRQAQLTIKM